MLGALYKNYIFFGAWCAWLHIVVPPAFVGLGGALFGRLADFCGGAPCLSARVSWARGRRWSVAPAVVRGPRWGAVGWELAQLVGVQRGGPLAAAGVPGLRWRCRGGGGRPRAAAAGFLCRAARCSSAGVCRPAGDGRCLPRRALHCVVDCAGLLLEKTETSANNRFRGSVLSLPQLIYNSIKYYKQTLIVKCFLFSFLWNELRKFDFPSKWSRK